MRRAGILFAFLGGLLIVGIVVSQGGDDPSPLGSPSANRLPQIGQPIASAAAGGGSAPALTVPPETVPPGATPRPLPQTGSSPRGAEASGVGSGPSSGGSGPFVSSLPLISDRKIIRSATIEVVVDDVGESVQLIETRAQAAGGFIAGSSLSIETAEQPAAPSATPTPERQRATITIRVPAETYPAVMNDIRALGNVKSETSDTSEVTEEYTDLEARLRNLQATEQQYLALLGRAAAIPDVLTVQDRLNNVRLESEQVQGRIQLLDNLTDLATITVTLGLPPLPSVEERPSPTPVPAAQPDEPTWSREAWDEAWGESQDVLETMGVAAITAAVILVWVLVPAVALGLGWRVFTVVSRRRQAS